MDKIFAGIELGLMVILFISVSFSKKYASAKWRLLYTAPILTAILFIYMDGIKREAAGIIAGAVFAGLGLFVIKNKWKRIIPVVSGLMIMVSLIAINISPDYMRKNYAEDYDNIVGILKEHYVIAEEKGLDFDQLYTEYAPLFKEVDKSQDYVENYKLWLRFLRNFHDGHVSYHVKDDKHAEKAVCESFGNDYGLSLIKLSTGEYAAINVEGCGHSYSITEDGYDELAMRDILKAYEPSNAEANRLTLKNAGIHNGTIITKWNGKPIDEYFDEIDYYMDQFPVKENEEFYRPIDVAGIGRDLNYGETVIPEAMKESCKKTVEGVSAETASVDITFINDKGEEETVKAPNLGSYFRRLFETEKKLNKGILADNLSWQRLSDDTAVLRIYSMSYDYKTYNGADYTEMTGILREELLGLKQDGVKNIIIDLRSNTGGSPYFVEGVAQLFAPEGEQLTYYNAVINEKTATYERGADGKYTMGVPSTFQGEDIWHDGKVILLVNAMTVSAGDDMTYIMGAYPNVKVMGITRSNSSCQAVTQFSGEAGLVSFSAVPTLFPDGSIAIDTFADRIGRTPFDERIPLDQEAVTAIFDKDEDYIMNYAINSFDAQ